MHLAQIILIYTCVELGHSICTTSQSQLDDCSHTSESESSISSSSCVDTIAYPAGSSESDLTWGEHAVVYPKRDGECPFQEDTEQDKPLLTLQQTYNISSIGVLKQQGIYKLYINSNFYAHNSCQFSLSLLSRDRPVSSEGLCKYYHIEYLRLRYFYTSFRDKCFVDLRANNTYDLKVTSPGTSFLRKYRLFTPFELRSDEELLWAQDHWQTLIGVTLHDDSITVYLQNRPRSSSYLLQLAHTKGELVQLEETDNHWLKSFERFVKFESPGDYLFTINLYRCDSRSRSDAFDPAANEDECSLVQQHTFQAAEILTRKQDNSATDMASVTSSDGQVRRESNSGVLQNQDLYILLGTIIGVLFLAIIVVVILFLYFRRRQGSHQGLTARFSGGNVYSDGLLFEEDAKSTPPTILLLYSYDCQQHLSCVQSLALLLQNALGCTVMADFWATQEIAERGIHLWLQHKMATVNYVIVVCSTGARFKSVTNRRLQLEQETDDAYIMAMKLLQSRTDTTGNQKLVVYFDYSCESDIPVLLENWERYKLMQDMNLLIPTVTDMCTKDGTYVCTTEHEQVYLKTLQEKINATKQYMAENPDWFHANLQANNSHESRQHSLTNSPSLSRSSQPLPVVTVERDHINSVTLTSPNVKRNSKSINTLPNSQLYTQPEPAWAEGGASSLRSYSSSLEDLEHDIDFILNPSLPSKAKYISSPLGLIDILPDLLPATESLPQIVFTERQRLSTEKQESIVQACLDVKYPISTAIDTMNSPKIVRV